MSKKFTKTVLSATVAGVLFGVSFGAMADTTRKNISDNYYIEINNGNNHGLIKDKKNHQVVIGPFDIRTGYITTLNRSEAVEALKKLQPGSNPNVILNSLRYSVYTPELAPDNISNLTDSSVNKLKTLMDKVAGTTNEKGEVVIKGKVTSKNAAIYNSTIKSGGDTDVYLKLVDTSPELANEYNRIVTKMDAMNDDVELLNKTTAQTQKYTETKISEIYDDVRGSLSATEMKANKYTDQKATEIYEDVKGGLTATELKANKYTDQKTSEVSGKIANLSGRTDRIDAAVGAVDNRLESRTTVGVNSDGTLTRAEGAAATIAVNDGLVQLSGRTDRIDAAVGAIDGRVTRNTQSIEKNSKAIAANTRTLQQHSARLDSQQRQINENHKEMKRAAAQSAALTGLFQPYSVGKFNASAAVGGYSDEQALAVGVGYRFNEQTAAKAGVAFSDGDASWNVGVNFEF